MNEYEVYEKYVAIKTHFNNEKYDYFKFKGRLRTIRVSSYEKRPDKYFFRKLSKRYPDREIVPFFVANFVESQDAYVMNLANESISEENFIRWRKRIESISKSFRDDIENIKFFCEEKKITFGDLLKPGNGHPIIFRFLLQDMIMIETFIILDKWFTFSKNLDSILIADPLWESYSLKCRKYSGFLSHLNYSKLEEIFREYFPV